MAQMGFFGAENRNAALEAKNNPLAKMNAAAAREAFHSRLKNVWRKPTDQSQPAERQGRPVRSRRVGTCSAREAGRVVPCRSHCPPFQWWGYWKRGPQTLIHSRPGCRGSEGIL